MKGLVLALQDEVASGTAFATALLRHPKIFNALYCNLVDAGEQAGALEGMLDRLRHLSAKRRRIRDGKFARRSPTPRRFWRLRWWSQAFSSSRWCPSLNWSSRALGQSYPLHPAGYQRLPQWAQAHYLAVMVGLTGSGFGLCHAHGQSPAIRDGLDRFLLCFPVLGSILEGAAVARSARTLATTFGADVPLVEGLRSAAWRRGQCGFPRRHAYPEERGHDGYGPRRRHERQPSLAQHASADGAHRRTGFRAVDDMLDKAAAHYEQEVDNAVESLTELLEPVITSVRRCTLRGEPDLGPCTYCRFSLGSVVGGGVG